MTFSRTLNCTERLRCVGNSVHTICIVLDHLPSWYQTSRHGHVVWRSTARDQGLFSVGDVRYLRDPSYEILGGSWNIWAGVRR